MEVILCLFQPIDPTFLPSHRPRPDPVRSLFIYCAHFVGSDDHVSAAEEFKKC